VASSSSSSWLRFGVPIGRECFSEEDKTTAGGHEMYGGGTIRHPNSGITTLHTPRYCNYFVRYLAWLFLYVGIQILVTIGSFLALVKLEPHHGEIRR
jgi:hypothetical protein